jgi:hypothetical protein
VAATARPGAVFAEQHSALLFTAATCPRSRSRSRLRATCASGRTGRAPRRVRPGRGGLPSRPGAFVYSRLGMYREALKSPPVPEVGPDHSHGLSEGCPGLPGAFLGMPSPWNGFTGPDSGFTAFGDCQNGSRQGWFDMLAFGPMVMAVLGRHVSEPQVRGFPSGRNVHVQAHPPAKAVIRRSPAALEQRVGGVQAAPAPLLPGAEVGRAGEVREEHAGPDGAEHFHVTSPPVRANPPSRPAPCSRTPGRFGPPGVSCAGASPAGNSITRTTRPSVKSTRAVPPRLSQVDDRIGGARRPEGPGGR